MDIYLYLQDKCIIFEKLLNFADLGGQVNMKRFLQCLYNYREACLEFQAHTASTAEVSPFTSSTSYGKLFALLSICLLTLRSRFGIFSELYEHHTTFAEDKIKQYLSSTLPSALQSARGDAVEFVKLWQKVKTHHQDQITLITLIFTAVYI